MHNVTFPKQSLGHYRTLDVIYDTYEQLYRFYFICDGNQIIRFAETQQYIIIVFSREKAMHCKYVCYFEHKDEDTQSDFSQRSKCWAGMDLSHIAVTAFFIESLIYLFIFLRIKVLQLKTNSKLDWII